MNSPKSIVVLCGGVGSERDISLVSGQSIADALKGHFDVELICLEEAQLPASVKGDRSVVFPALHGEFGEDGSLQALLEDAGIQYCGSDATASRLCMAKDKTKLLAQDLGIKTPKGIAFDGVDTPLADAVINELGPSLIIKPTDQGSSVGLHFAEHRSALGAVLSRIRSGRWLIEERIRGRELTVGILGGKALGVVEILSAIGVYDYKAKYTKGATEYRYPADLETEVDLQVKQCAERLFDACGCRDFARVDFLLEAGQIFFLEINTLPGLTATSLLPKSAACNGVDFETLALELVAPAIRRFVAAAK